MLSQQNKKSTLFARSLFFLKKNPARHFKKKWHVICNFFGINQIA